MANQVYANGMEIACKAAAGKTICAFPDVCFTPPQTPATPPGVPIPYPNTGLASDTTDGSKNVKITGKEVMLKSKSCFKKSSGDEAGSAPKKGVITSKNTGKVFFNSWSMDVKIEGENADRNLDLTTNNHASMPGDTPPWPYIDKTAFGVDAAYACQKEIGKEHDACSGKTAEQACDDKACQDARACMLVPYETKGKSNCCPGKTGHHLLPNCLVQNERGKISSNVPGLINEGNDAYTLNKGACVCVDGSSNHLGTHGEIHEKTKEKLIPLLTRPGKDMTFEEAKSAVAEVHTEVIKKDDGTPQCSKECIEAQLDSSFNRHSTGEEIEVRQRDGTTVKNYPKEEIGDID
jgi:hypothetical protein